MLSTRIAAIEVANAGYLSYFALRFIALHIWTYHNENKSSRRLLETKH